MAQAVQDNLEVPKWFKNLVSQHRPRKSVAIFLGFPEGTRQNKGCCKIDNFIFTVTFIFTFTRSCEYILTFFLPFHLPGRAPLKLTGEEGNLLNQIKSIQFSSLRYQALQKILQESPKTFHNNKTIIIKIFLLNNVYRM